MKRGMLGFVPALLALLAALVVVAWAQGDKGAAKDSAAGSTGAGTPPAASGGGFSTQTSAQFGISIDLPAGSGTVLTPDNPNWPWKDVPEMAYDWYGGNSGVKEALVHVYTFQLPVTQASFKDFTGALLQNFEALDQADADKMAKDKASGIKQAIGMEKVKPHFAFGAKNALWEINGNMWNNLEVKDLRNDKQPVSYSVVSTFYGNKIYTITLIYLSDLSPQVKSVAQQIMTSLKVSGATGPLGVEQMAGQMPAGAGSTMPPGAASPGAAGAGMPPAAAPGKAPAGAPAGHS